MAKAKKKTVRREEEVEPVVTEEVVMSDNRSLLSKIIIVILVLVGLYLIVNFVSGQDNDNGDKAAKDDDSSKVEESDKSKDDKKSDEATSEDQADSTSVEETDEAFTFTVGGGESYTTMARRAIASTDSKLSHAERVAAETKLVSEANAEWLNEGQDLTLNKDAIKAAIDWAKGLSAEEKAAWQPYADMIAW